MEELTHPQAYYEFFGKRRYRFFQEGIIAGGALALVGLLCRFIPRLNAALRALGGFAAFMSAAGWLLLVLVGAGLIALLLLVPMRLRAVTLFPNGIAVAGRGGKRRYPFSSVKSVTDCRVGNKRVATLQIQGEPRPIRWDDDQLRDYIKCMTELEALRAQYLLGDPFPENLASLDIKFGARVRLAGGILHYDEIPLTALHAYTAARYEELEHGKPDIVLHYGDGQRVTLLCGKTGCRVALLRVLDALLPQPEEPATAPDLPEDYSYEI